MFQWVPQCGRGSGNRGRVGRIRFCMGDLRGSRYSCEMNLPREEGVLLSDTPEWMRREVHHSSGGRCECTVIGCDHPVDLSENSYLGSLLGQRRCARTFPYQRESDLQLGPLALALLPPPWHCDHKIRQSDGGPTELSNLQALCVPCHEEKTRRENLAE